MLFRPKLPGIVPGQKVARRGQISCPLVATLRKQGKLRSMVRMDTSASAQRLRSEREARGWTQREAIRRLRQLAATELPSDESLIRNWKKWEAGNHQPDDFYRPLIAKLFGTATSTLFPVSPRRAVHTGLEDEEIIVPCRTLDGRITWVSIPRRTFLLGGLGAIGVAAGIPARPGGPAGTVNPTTAKLQAALGRAAEMSPVEHLQQVRRILIDSDNLLGPRHVIPAVHDQIQLIQQLRASRKGADRQALLVMQAEYAEFAGWLHQDSSDFRGAQFWLDRALEWSHGAGDHELATYVMVRKSQLAGDMRDGTSATDIAEAASNMARRGSRLEATAATYGAHGYALSGENTACLRAIDNAREMANRLNDDPESPWATWLDDAYIEVQRGRCLSILGNHKQAVSVFQQAIEELPPAFHRDRGVYLAREALAHAGARNPEQAADVGMKALAIAHDTQSGRIIDELARVDSDLAPWATLPAVTDFRDALTSVIPSERAC